ncbi:MAG: hypothetical protein ACXADH_13495, partial [Candidatus Kariarchaeaceae archaeon]
FKAEGTSRSVINGEGTSLSSTRFGGTLLSRCVFDNTVDNWFSVASGTGIWIAGTLWDSAANNDLFFSNASGSLLYNMRVINPSGTYQIFEYCTESVLLGVSIQGGSGNSRIRESSLRLCKGFDVRDVGRVAFDFSTLLGGFIDSSSVDGTNEGFRFENTTSSITNMDVINCSRDGLNIRRNNVISTFSTCEFSGCGRSAILISDDSSIRFIGGSIIGSGNAEYGLEMTKFTKVGVSAGAAGVTITVDGALGDVLVGTEEHAWGGGTTSDLNKQAIIIEE